MVVISTHRPSMRDRNTMHVQNPIVSGTSVLDCTKAISRLWPHFEDRPFLSLFFVLVTGPSSAR